MYDPKGNVNRGVNREVIQVAEFHLLELKSVISKASRTQLIKQACGKPCLPGYHPRAQPSSWRFMLFRNKDCFGWKWSSL